MSRAGLCAFDSALQKIVILKRNHPYGTGMRWRQSPSTFVEQYSLPRGKCLNSSEPLIQCAIREFIEETGMFFEKFRLFNEGFQLTWTDPEHKIWKYEIFFIEADLSIANTIKVDEFSNLEIPKIGMTTDVCKFTKYEPAVKLIMSIPEYIKLLENQILCYKTSNYLDFVNHLKKIST